MDCVVWNCGYPGAPNPRLIFLRPVSLSITQSIPPFSAISKSTDAVDLGARDEGGGGGPESRDAGHHRPSNGYSEEWLDRLEPNGNIPKDGSLHRGQYSGRPADATGRAVWVVVLTSPQ